MTIEPKRGISVMVTKKHSPTMRLLVAILTLSLFAPTVSVSAQNAERPTITNDDVIQMVTANLSESLILSQIADSQTRFDLSTAELIRLSTSGVSDTIIAAMRTPSSPADTPPPQPVVAPVVDPPVVDPPSAPVVAPVVTPPDAPVGSLTEQATALISPESNGDGQRDGEQLADTVGTGGKVLGGAAVGFLTGGIGTAIGYFVIGPEDLSAEAALARDGKSSEYQQGFSTGWADKTRSKKRNSFLIGGILGTAAAIVAIIQLRSQTQEECGYLGNEYMCY